MKIYDQLRLPHELQARLQLDLIQPAFRKHSPLKAQKAHKGYGSGPQSKPKPGDCTGGPSGVIDCKSPGRMPGGPKFAPENWTGLTGKPGGAILFPFCIRIIQFLGFSGVVVIAVCGLGVKDPEVWVKVVGDWVTVGWIGFVLVPAEENKIKHSIKIWCKNFSTICIYFGIVAKGLKLLRSARWPVPKQFAGSSSSPWGQSGPPSQTKSLRMHRFTCSLKHLKRPVPGASQSAKTSKVWITLYYQ